jgi:hypothetical protein
MMKIGALVALYGEKPTTLVQLISECQAQIASAAGSAFRPYDIRQVHATIVGFGMLNAPPMINACFYEYRGRQVQMDFDGLLGFLRGSGYLPFQIQIGGFQDRDYPFASRGLRPYKRSFSFRDGKAVVIGWPIRGTPHNISNSTPINLIHEARIYPNTIDEIRQAVQAFGFLHRYYRSVGDVDNDFYFRIGLYDPVSISERMQHEIEHNLRQFLSKLQPVLIEITVSEVYIAFNEYETFPPESTLAWAVSDPSVTADTVKNFYLRTSL